jgi:hypothetical protein
MSRLNRSFASERRAQQDLSDFELQFLQTAGKFGLGRGGFGGGGGQGSSGNKGAKGDQGNPGAPGAPGADGANAFALLGGGGFIQPAIGSNVTITSATVTDFRFMDVGQIIYIETGGYYQVVSVDLGASPNTAVITNLGYFGNAAAGAGIITFPNVPKISPGGLAGNADVLRAHAFGTAGGITMPASTPLVWPAGNEADNFPGGGYDSVTGIFTIPQDGHYAMSMMLKINNANATTQYRAQLAICSGRGPSYTTLAYSVMNIPALASTSGVVTFSGPTLFSAGEAISFQWFDPDGHFGSTGLTVEGGDASSQAGIYLVSIN